MTGSLSPILNNGVPLTAKSEGSFASFFRGFLQLIPKIPLFQGKMTLQLKLFGSK
jgi:hypothetical protein